jgi:hypothetical protein
MNTQKRGYLVVTKGVRIGHDNVTIDMPPQNAERIRTILMSVFQGVPVILDDINRELILKMCDGIAGPLNAHIQMTGEDQKEA